LINIKEKDFMELLNQHKNLIYKVCHFYATDEYLKQDLFQEIVIQLWKSYESFRNKSKVSTWMYRVALNTALSEKRRSKTKITLSFIGLSHADQSDENDISGNHENINMLYSAISQLTEIEKALVMLYLDDKSYEEMNEVLGISQGALRVKMNRIKEKLRHITKSSHNGN